MATGPAALRVAALRDDRRRLLVVAGAGLLAGVALVVAALTGRRLELHAASAMRELRASRARIAAAAEQERRRIERDLHDGAQQRLVALRIELELAEETVLRDPERGVQRLRELQREVDRTLEELRELAHGVHPALLSDCGLVTALEAAAARAPLPVRVEARAVGRYAPEVESAVYFCLLEALQNVLKHAPAARDVRVELDGAAAGVLRIGVRDDGSGASNGRLPVGEGIAGMRDRLVALGGDLAVTSLPGRGTVVRGWVPAPPCERAAVRPG